MTHSGLSIRFEVGVCPYNSRRLWLFRWPSATFSRAVWGHAPPRKFWNLEARKCDFQHSWHEKVKLMMHTINPLIGRFLCVFQELLWTCKVIEFGRSACHVTYQGPSCNPTLKFTPKIMIYSQCGRKAMRRCCHSTESIANFFIKNCDSACTGLSTEFPNDEWTKY